MSSAERLNLVSVDQYLEGELLSDVKHEYVGGILYAMAGGRNIHNLVAGNAFGALHQRLRGSDCRPYNSDTKIRIRTQTQTRFYYPDVSVICRPNASDDTFQDHPVVIVEVLSETTRRIDEGEKKDAYLTIPSLALYLLTEPERPAVAVYRRGDQGFDREVYVGVESVIPLPEIGIELPLVDLYDGAALEPEA